MMPKGPKGQKRPADVIGNAIMVAKIATGEIEENPPTKDRKRAAAAKLGKVGGKVRADKMSAEERTEAAKKAARARWTNSPARAEKE
jgi:hypothetical protein